MTTSATSAATTQAPDPLPVEAPDRGRSGDRLAAWLVVAVAVMVAAVWQTVRAGVWHQSSYFDEIWRIDFIRAADPLREMLDRPKPIGYGWLLLMRLITRALPYDLTIWRGIAAAFMVLAFLVLAIVLCRIGPPDRRLHPMVCGFAAAALPFFLPVRLYLTYFNNYGFEVLYAALMVLAAIELPRHRWALPALCVLLALAPAFVLGPLLMVPALAGSAALWAWRSPDAGVRRRRLTLLGASLAVGAADLAAVQLAFYGPMSNSAESPKGYWVGIGTALGGDRGLGDILGSFVGQLRDGVTGHIIGTDGGAWLAPATVLAVVSLAAGVVVVARRAPLLLVTALSAQVLTIPLSAVTGWPIDLQRTNLGFQLLLILLFPLGFGQLVLLAVRRVRAPAWAVLPVLAMVLGALWFPSAQKEPTTFGRQLYDDLGLVARSPVARNLVVEYHPMGRYTAHDRLINTRTAGRTFELVSEDPGDQSLYESPLDRLITSAGLRRGDAVWCVMPNQMGPVRFRRACHFSPSRVALVREVRLSRTVLRQLVVR